MRQCAKEIDMSDKLYVSANDYLRDCFRLARMVLDSGWLPDDLIVLWRGGAPVGVSIHEPAATPPCAEVPILHRY